jgi:hypothetical protein
MKSIIKSMVLAMLIITPYMLSACTTTPNNDTEHEWLQLTGTYHVTYYGGLPFHTEQSYLLLTIDEDGKCGGLFKITSPDLSYSDIDKIDDWLYDSKSESITLTYYGEKPVVYEVVEYGKIIKFDNGEFRMILEK